MTFFNKHEIQVRGGNSFGHCSWNQVDQVDKVDIEHFNPNSAGTESDKSLPPV